MPSTCRFLLNRKNGVYYSGELVKGSIVLSTTSEKRIRNIRIRILGEAKVHWSEKRSRKKSNGTNGEITVHYKANEVYVDKTTIVHLEETLPPGSYTFKCNFRLPKSCPTSCGGKHGHIRYSLELTVDRPYHYDNEFSRPLTVLKRVDLNLNPTFKVPLQAEEVSSIGCWACASGQIMYTLRVPFGAYASGQTLHYSLSIQNQSMTDISGYKVEFVESMTFIAHRPDTKSREIQKVVAWDDYSDSCLRLSNRQFDGELVLPSLPPDTGDHGIIRVEHTLDLEIIVRGCHSNNSISVPIVIGNMPIRESLHARPPAPPLPAIELASAPLLSESSDDEDSSDSDNPPSYADLQPPSFEEAVRSSSPFVDPEANEHHHVIGFQPLYPMYPH